MHIVWFITSEVYMPVYGMLVQTACKGMPACMHEVRCGLHWFAAHHKIMQCQWVKDHGALGDHRAGCGVMQQANCCFFLSKTGEHQL